MQARKMILGAGVCGILAGAFAACNAPRETGSTDPSARNTIASDAPAVRASLAASGPGGRRLVRVYFNPYTDSIKTMLNYYVNVEGQYSDGTYLPLDTTEIILRSDVGTMAGNEWVLPKKIDFEKVVFTAVSRADGRLQDTVTLWIQKWKDPRDAADYRDAEDAQEAPHRH